MTQGKRISGISKEKQDLMHNLSTCMTCGCCLEGWRKVNSHSLFIGPAAISHALFFQFLSWWSFFPSTKRFQFFHRAFEPPKKTPKAHVAFYRARLVGLVAQVDMILDPEGNFFHLVETVEKSLFYAFDLRL